MKFPFNGKEWYIDGFLASALDSLAYNVNKDFDFVIMITGDRTVRVGKSVLAMTISAYLSYALNLLGLKNEFSVKDIYFDNQEMMKEAFKKPKYHVNQYDEGREGLAAAKAMKGMQQDLIDFFSECGQMNHVFVIVAPDFFKLNEEIAVARSEFLINVYRKETQITTNKFKDRKPRQVTRLDRGYFEFFSRKKKQNLYDKSQSTRRKNYQLIKADFYGSFVNQYPVGEDEYRQKKKDSLARFTQRKEDEKKIKGRDKFLQMAIANIKDNNPKYKWDDVRIELSKLGKEMSVDAIRKNYQRYKDLMAVEAAHKSESLTKQFRMPNSTTG